MTERIYFAGAEKIDWALNEDLRLLKASLSAMEEAKSLNEATIVHSVWWGGLQEIPREKLEGKRIICQFDNPPYHWIKQSSFREAVATVNLWIVQSREAEKQANTLGLNTHFIPYKLNTDIFQPLSQEERMKIRSSLGISESSFVIGNFHRDTDGGDLSRPKTQKAPDFFLEIISALKNLDLPVHALLAGPRRHWLRKNLTEREIPFTFVGEVISGDDIKSNILSRNQVAKLYGALDLCLVTSRWEGGPYSLLEASATLTPILSTTVGMASDILEPAMMFRSLGEAIEKITLEFKDRKIRGLTSLQLEKVRKGHTVDSVQTNVKELIKRLSTLKPYSPPEKQEIVRTPQVNHGPIRSLWKQARKLLRNEVDSSANLTVSIFREFVKPPYGGGNQFMLALKNAFEQKGVRVLVNEVDDQINGYFFDSLWFEENLLKKLENLSKPPVVVHRIDGPIHLYRGKDKEIDDKIFEVNKRLATSTVIQSEFTLEKVFQTGYRPVRPVIIRNAVNPSIFFPRPDKKTRSGPKLRIVASSWSDNPNKGGPVYKWLEEHLDWSKYEFTFVGRCSENLTKAKVIAPVSSEKLASILNEHDVYITASQNDPCSNALIEAMSCGLPAIALRSGGHPELIGFGGLCFERQEEIPSILEEIFRHHEAYRILLSPPSMDNVAARYLELIKEP